MVFVSLTGIESQRARCILAINGTHSPMGKSLAFVTLKRLVTCHPKRDSVKNMSNVIVILKRPGACQPKVDPGQKWISASQSK